MAEKQRANYSDWFSGGGSINPWRMADLDVAQADPPDCVDIYLTRDRKLLRTFMITLDEKTARWLRDKLNDILGD